MHLKKHVQQRGSKILPVKPSTGSGVSEQKRFRVPAAVVQKIAFCMIGMAVILSWFMTPIPIAVGFTVVAVIRIILAVREARREAANGESDERVDKSGVCSV